MSGLNLKINDVNFNFFKDSGGCLHIYAPLFFSKIRTIYDEIYPSHGGSSPSVVWGNVQKKEYYFDVQEPTIPRKYLLEVLNTIFDQEVMRPEKMEPVLYDLVSRKAIPSSRYCLFFSSKHLYTGPKVNYQYSDSNLL